MAIVLHCPSCERRLRVPDNLLGAKVKCPTCGTVFLGEASEAPSAPTEEKVVSPPAPLDHLEEVEDQPPPDREDEEPRRRKRRSVRRRQDDEDDDEYGIRKRVSYEKPGKVQAIAIMMLVGGILAILLALGLGIGSGAMCCLWPGTYYSIVMGILAILKGSQLLGDKAHLQPAPRGIAIMMIINIVSGDMANLAMGIICLIFLGEPEVKAYFRE
jgi:predicted Zn finger-like uncharacterized protein